MLFGSLDMRFTLGKLMGFYAGYDLSQDCPCILLTFGLTGLSSISPAIKRYLPGIKLTEFEKINRMFYNRNIRGYKYGIKISWEWPIPTWQELNPMHDQEGAILSERWTGIKTSPFIIQPYWKGCLPRWEIYR